MTEILHGITASTEKAAILRARAQALAQEIAQVEVVEQHLEVVEFSLAGEQFAVETVHVREVCPIQDLTPIPCTPPHVCGMINVRGQVLTVLDLKKLFALREQGLVDRHHVIILHTKRLEAGLLADGTPVVRSLRRSDLQPSLSTLSGVRAEYLRGVTCDGLVVLDAARLLWDPRLIVDEEVTA
jgi:purine-binding chemotaxis protein CheW